MSAAIIQARGLSKRNQMGDVEVHALEGVSFDVARGEMVAIADEPIAAPRTAPAERVAA